MATIRRDVLLSGLFLLAQLGGRGEANHFFPKKRELNFNNSFRLHPSFVDGALPLTRPRPGRKALSPIFIIKIQ